MLYRIPDYYKEFRCIAGACEDTCCAGWQIVIDRGSLGKYREDKSGFGRNLQKGIDWKRSVFRQGEGRRCAFLNEDNLCDMYAALGGGALCRTCRLYPRHVEEFEGVREITLSLSCPEVARILLSRTEPVSWKTVEREGEEEFDDFDPFLYSQLLDAREVIRKILQDRKIPLEVRRGLVYGLAHDMQKRVNQRELFSCGEVFEKYQRGSAREFVGGKVIRNKKNAEKKFAFAREMFQKLFLLETLKADWRILLLETEQRLYTENSAEEYRVISEEFHAWMSESRIPWEIQKEQLLVYFIDTYFCGAVYDGQILKKVQFADISVLLIEEILKMRWLRNEKMLDMEEIMEVVYRYSREVEHSDNNLNKLEDRMPFEHGWYC